MRIFAPLLYVSMLASVALAGPAPEPANTKAERRGLARC